MLPCHQKCCRQKLPIAVLLVFALLLLEVQYDLRSVVLYAPTFKKAIGHSLRLAEARLAAVVAIHTTNFMSGRVQSGYFS